MTETFSTLVGLLQAADLVDTLSGPGPFTVFAPTNDAFAKIDAATLEEAFDYDADEERMCHQNDEFRNLFVR